MGGGGARDLRLELHGEVGRRREDVARQHVPVGLRPAQQQVLRREDSFSKSKMQAAAGAGGEMAREGLEGRAGEGNAGRSCSPCPGKS